MICKSKLILVGIENTRIVDFRVKFRSFKGLWRKLVVVKGFWSGFQREQDCLAWIFLTLFEERIFLVFVFNILERGFLFVFGNLILAFLALIVNGFAILESFVKVIELSSVNLILHDLIRMLSQKFYLGTLTSVFLRKMLN